MLARNGPVGNSAFAIYGKTGEPLSRQRVAATAPDELRGAKRRVRLGHSQ